MKHINYKKRVWMRVIMLVILAFLSMGSIFVLWGCSEGEKDSEEANSSIANTSDAIALSNTSTFEPSPIPSLETLIYLTDVVVTATANFWETSTAEYHLSVSIEAARTETAAAYKTETATLWTPTPTATHTLTPTLTPLEIAERGVSSNAEWSAYVGIDGMTRREFDGVTMVLVPAGCFMMGSENGQSNELPVHEQCFEEPFWIDETEVTNAQYGSVACPDSFDPDQPRNCISWLSAKGHCEARGGRLPTEREWEYAARGPDSWEYPWGNEFVGEYVVHLGSPEYQDIKIAPVGSRPEGASWVGALDMAGNLSEWTSSIYEDYPYDPEDGREQVEDTDSRIVLRGGDFGKGAQYLRSAFRSRYPSNTAYNNFGFRCVHSYDN